MVLPVRALRRDSKTQLDRRKRRSTTREAGGENASTRLMRGLYLQEKVCASAGRVLVPQYDCPSPSFASPSSRCALGGKLELLSSHDSAGRNGKVSTASKREVREKGTYFVNCRNMEKERERGELISTQERETRGRDAAHVDVEEIRVQRGLYETGDDGDGVYRVFGEVSASGGGRVGKKVKKRKTTQSRKERKTHRYTQFGTYSALYAPSANK